MSDSNEELSQAISNVESLTRYINRQPGQKSDAAVVVGTLSAIVKLLESHQQRLDKVLYVETLQGQSLDLILQRIEVLEYKVENK